MAGKPPKQNMERKLTAGKSVGLLGKRYLMWTAYGIIIFLSVLIQTLPHGFPPVFDVTPLLIVPAAVCISMFEGPAGGAAAGVAGGLLWDMFTTRPMGFHALLLMILCCGCGLLSQMLIRNNLISTMMITAAALFIRGITDWFFNGVLSFRPELLNLLFRHGFSAAYTLLITPLVYLAVWATARALHRRDEQ